MDQLTILKVSTNHMEGFWLSGSCKYKHFLNNSNYLLSGYLRICFEMIDLRYYFRFFRCFRRITKEQWGSIVTEEYCGNSEKDM